MVVDINELLKDKAGLDEKTLGGIVLVQAESQLRHFDTRKRMSVTKYLRKVLRDMSILELAAFIDQPNDVQELIASVARGYDDFMVRRQKRA